MKRRPGPHGRSSKVQSASTAFGQSLHVDCFGVPRRLCTDLSFSYALLDELATMLKMHKQSPPFVFHSPDDRFPDKAGISGWVPLIESGISIHTLTERRFATVDLYTCGALNVPRALRFISAALRAKRVQHHVLMRGTGYRPRSPV